MIKQHLISRGVKDFTGVTLCEDVNLAYFWLYNLFGQIAGYQQYNPNGTKNISRKEMNPRDQKYYTYLSEHLFWEGNKSCFWGTQFYNHNKKDVFLVEGIFDAVKIINEGYNAFATLNNDPRIAKNYIKLLKDRHNIIVIADNDAAGRKLLKYGDSSYVCEGHDLGDMTQEEAHTFIHNILNKT